MMKTKKDASIIVRVITPRTWKRLCTVYILRLLLFKGKRLLDFCPGSIGSSIGSIYPFIQPVYSKYCEPTLETRCAMQCNTPAPEAVTSHEILTLLPGFPQRAE